MHIDVVNMSLHCNYGKAQAGDFEPLEAISDWLLSSPDVDWVKQMKEASQVGFVQKYHL